MKKYECGLLGKKLSHSYSPYIHAYIGDYEYRLFEKTEEELETFLKTYDWIGLNVTAPYKERVMHYCDYLSDLARAVGSVNTVVKDNSGRIYGYNTDVAGFKDEIRAAGINIKGKKALVLGSGGASKSVCYALSNFGATPVVISRAGEHNYQNISNHHNANLIINTTPVGMYPNTGQSPLDLQKFISCEYVIDIIYNPYRTKLLIQAEELNIPCKNGLYMLFSQAIHSSRIFMCNPKKGVRDKNVLPLKGLESASDIFTDCNNETENKIKLLFNKFSKELLNIVLVGMPGCGKTTIGKALAKRLGKICLDSDEIFTKENKCTPGEYIGLQGEERFRIKEGEILSRIGKASGAVISTGGGAVTIQENFSLLYQNGIIIWLKRDIEKLCIKDRPISGNADLSKLFRVRKPQYRQFSQHSCENNGTIEDTVSNILEILDDRLGEIL